MSIVIITQQPHIDFNTLGGEMYYAAGHFSGEDLTTGSTLEVMWDIIPGRDDGSECDWDHPSRIHHYSLGWVDVDSQNFVHV